MRIPLLLLALALAAPSAAGAQVFRRAVATIGLQDGALAITSRNDDRIDLSFASRDSSGEITVSSAALRAWRDSAQKLAARKARKPGEHVRAMMFEDGETGAALSLVRQGSADGTRYSLFFSNRRYGGFPIPLEPSEVDIVLTAAKRAVATTDTLSGRVRGRKKVQL